MGKKLEWKLEDGVGNIIEQHDNESKIRETYVLFDMDKKPVRLYSSPIGSNDWTTEDWNFDLDTGEIS